MTCRQGRNLFDRLWRKHANNTSPPYGSYPALPNQVVHQFAIDT